MKYETPELTALAPAVEAIQRNSSRVAKNMTASGDSVPLLAGQTFNEHVGAYADWE